MKKLRTKLFSLLGITSIIGTTTTIATSCGPSKQTRFNLSGGSLSLNAISGNAGKDTAAWKLYTSGGKEITSGITWKLTSATSAQLPNSISIANGLVSWTSQIEVGTYEFSVCANYKNTNISTKKITLLVSSENYNLSGGSLSLNTISGNAGKDTAAWKLYSSDGKEITSGITWKLTSATSAQLPTSISIANGLVSWTSQITTGTYEFYVCANYKDAEISTKKITLLASSENYNLSGGSLSLNTISGNAGKDTAAWKLYSSDGKEITSGITWKLTSATSAQLPTSISIANGLVSWTSQITAGTYEFYVCANYKDAEISTKKITLLASSENYNLSGGSLSLNTISGNAGKDTAAWKLYTSGGKEITSGITWKLTSATSAQLPTSISIANGLVSWTSQITTGTYEFYVCANYKDAEISTKKITLLVSAENYNLSGGSLSLNTISGNAGKDTAAWKLYTSGGKEITSGITWKLTSATSAQLPTSISIANGLVSWTSQITTGTYEFYVCANYKDTEISTEKITLLVSPSQYVIGFEDNKISYYNPFIKKDEDITLNLEMDEATGNVTYTSTQSINVDVTSSGEIKFKPIFENSSSIYISKNIMYEIIYDNTSQINYNKSIFIYHSNEWLLQDDYPLTFAAFAPIYNKAKIKVTFECDSKVSLIMPIDVWYDRTTPDSKFEIPSGKEEEYKDKIIINYDEGLNTYNCYLNSSNPDNLQNIVPFDICLVCPTGCYSSKNFEITDIQNDVLTEGSCKINVEEQIVPENVEMEDGSIMPTAIILYNIHVEFLPNGNMPTDENYKHNLFTINKKTLDGSILESKCNIIWWFKSLAH